MESMTLSVAGFMLVVAVSSISARFSIPSEDGRHVIFTFTTNSHKPDPTRKTTNMHLQASNSSGGGAKETIKISHEEKKICLYRAVREALGHWRPSSVKSFNLSHGVRRGHLKSSVCSEWACTCISALLEQAEYLNKRTASSEDRGNLICFLPVFLSAWVWSSFEMPAVIPGPEWLETLH